MPIKHAALRQIRKDRKRAERNQAVQSLLKTLKKRARLLLEQDKREEMTQFLPEIIRQFDRAAAKGVIHHNVASRTKSRLMRRLGKPPASTRPSAQRPKSARTAPSPTPPAPSGESSAQS